MMASVLVSVGLGVGITVRVGVAAAGLLVGGIVGGKVGDEVRVEIATYVLVGGIFGMVGVVDCGTVIIRVLEREVVGVVVGVVVIIGDKVATEIFVLAGVMSFPSS